MYLYLYFEKVFVPVLVFVLVVVFAIVVVVVVSCGVLIQYAKHVTEVGYVRSWWFGDIYVPACSLFG